MNIKKIGTQFTLVLITCLFSACVVVPEKTVSYDSKCKASVQKINLNLAPVEYYIDDWSCTNESCALLMPIELGDAVFITATSAIISGSIAVVGNTMYWLGRQDTCPFNDSLEKKSPEQPSENINDPYQIREEIITAKS